MSLRPKYHWIRRVERESTITNVDAFCRKTVSKLLSCVSEIAWFCMKKEINLGDNQEKER